VNYKHRAVEKFWRNFYKLRPEQKESVRRSWQLFKGDPFHPSLGSHEIHELSARAIQDPFEQALLRFLASRVNGADTEENLADLTQFAGAIRLSEDPLAWQRRLRDEWE